MSSWFEVGTSVLRYGYSFVLDLANLVPRPLVLANHLLKDSSPWWLSALQGNGLIVGVSSTISLGLIFVSSLALSKAIVRSEEPLIRFAGALYLADACLQLGSMAGVVQYPVSRVFLLPQLVQLPFSLIALVHKDFFRYLPVRNLSNFAVGLSAYMWSRQIALEAPGHAGSRFFFGVAVLMFVVGLLPNQMLKYVGQFLEFLARIFSTVYAFVARFWPYVRDFVIRLWLLLDHPIVVFLHRRIVSPLWRILTPWPLPVASAAAAYSMYLAIFGTVQGGLDYSTHEILLLSAQAVGALSASVSALVLGAHALARALNMQIDPLRFSFVVRPLMFLSHVISSPLTLIRKLTQNRLLLRFIKFFLDIFFRFIDAAFHFAGNFPLLAIPCVVAANIGLGYVIYTNELGDSFLSFFTTEISRLFSALALVRDSPIQRAADSTLAMGLVAVSQILIYSLVKGILLGVPLNTAPGSLSTSMSMDELDALAEGMGDPRQCGRCGFGPIDYSGCSNLMSHHLEVRGGSSIVSNSCSVCGWFVPDLEYWPYWSVRTAVSRSVLRIRVWGEVVLSVRAAAKALVIPVALLKLCGTQYPALGAFLAFSYLIPWALENSRTYFSVYGVLTRYPRRGGNNPRGQAPNDDCGHMVDNVAALGTISASDALEAILTAIPVRIFTVAGDICSVCLDSFPDEAFRTIETLSNEEACRSLRLAEPPIVALRCGHCLHIPCAEQVVASAEARHVRCPLCREPVSLSGNVAGRFFA